MVLISFGTRPEYIKVKPIIDKFIEKDIPFKTVFTGQHLNTLGKIEYDYELSIKDGDNRLDAIVKSILGNDYIFKGIRYVMVQGDTTSSLAMALSSFHRQIKVIHLEAGLRTFDKDPYPEEMNRVLISRLADIHFCATEINHKNLLAENCKGDIYVTGNTVIDSISHLSRNRGYNNQVIITLHRRENHHLIGEYFKIINELQEENTDLSFILPIHPNPNVQKHKNLLSSIDVISPVEYDKMIDLISKCKFIITDSGGLQEEGSYFNKRIIVCRETTERPETLGTHSVLCKKPQELKDLFERIKNNFEINSECPFGNGNAADNIVEILIKKYF